MSFDVELCGKFSPSFSSQFLIAAIGDVNAYLLLKKIASKEARNSDLVAATRLELVTPGL